MDIIKLQGTDKKLYELIAPLVLNPAVLRQNNNYPFKTGPKYTWYIAIEKEQILGFIPIKQTSVSSLMINNYYIKGDNLTILDKLLSEILANILQILFLIMILYQVEFLFVVITYSHAD